MMHTIQIHIYLIHFNPRTHTECDSQQELPVRPHQ